MNKISVAVLFGGCSSEHDISLMSATTVIKNLDKDKYNIYLIGITKLGEFFKYDGDIENIKNGSWINREVKKCIISPDREHHGIVCFDNGTYEVINIDVAIPVLHGKNGEDGTIQGLLQLAGINFVGCDCISSANCMDKELTHIILENAGVKMASWVCGKSYEDFDDIVNRVENKLEYPVFIKPANAGSSIGVSKANNKEELIRGLDIAFKNDKKAIIEETIVGKEVECAVLGNENPKATLPGEIASANEEIYDFEAKYINPESTLYIPARISEDTMVKIQQQAVKAYKAIGCEGLSRVDFFAKDNGEILLNEINTFPGFTSISMYPKMWENMGLKINNLLDELITYAIKRR